MNVIAIVFCARLNNFIIDKDDSEDDTTSKYDEIDVDNIGI